MTNKLKSVKRGSKSASAPQPKTAQSRAIVRPESNPPCIALFPQGDTSVFEEVIDLSKAEYAELKRAARPTRDGVLMFMARAALEKARWPDTTGHAPKAGSAFASSLCLFDASVGELAGEIPLVGKELPQVVIAAHRQHTTVDHFIADAIREKLGKPRDKAPSPSPDDGIIVKLTGEHGTELGTVKIDDGDAELLQKAAAASELELTELLHFIANWRLSSLRKSKDFIASLITPFTRFRWVSRN
jgi:uncharacterized protein (DUF1778 family)